MLNMRNLTTLVFAAVFCACALLLSVEHLTFFVSDDAYYYLTVARNITRGVGSNFDGIDATNGYHPLWMLCLLPVYRLWGSSAELSLRMTLLVQALIVAATLWLAWDVLRRYAASSIAIIVAIALVCTLDSPLDIMFNGLETDLVILLIVALLHADARYSLLDRQQPPGQQAWFGLLFGLVVLARLDEALLIVGIAIWYMLGKQLLARGARLAFLCRSHWLTAVVFAAVLTPYFVWNLGEFGHLTPISGTLKATFPQLVFRWRLLVDYLPYVALTLLAGLALIPMLRHPDDTLRRPHLDLLAGIWIGCLLQICWAVFFTRWGTFQWHFAAHIPTACLILSCYAARLAPRPKPFVAAIVCGAAASVVVAFNTFTYYDKGDYHNAAYGAATWARSHTPRDTVFALPDAGVFGYFSERPTIDLDGLVNSYQYQEYVRDGRLMEFLRQRGVTYVADASSVCHYSERHVWIRSHMPPRPPLGVAYGLTVAREAEAYRGDANLFKALSVGKPRCFIAWPFDKVWLEIRSPSIPVSE